MITEFLGKVCKDKISGFEGVCTGLIFFLTGCHQCVLEKKGEKGTALNIDEGRLEIIGDGIDFEHLTALEADRIGNSVESTAELRENLGKKIRDKLSGVEGICSAIIYDLYGAHMIIIIPRVIDNNIENLSNIHRIPVSRAEIISEGGITPEDVTSENHGGYYSCADLGIAAGARKWKSL